MSMILIIGIIAMLTVILGINLVMYEDARREEEEAFEFIIGKLITTNEDKTR